MSATVSYSRVKLLENVERLRDRLPFAKVHYAVKACGEESVLAVIKDAGLGFEAASAEEFELLLGLDVSPDRITCGLPMKGPLLIRKLYQAGCRHFVFDCAEEFEALCSEAPLSKKLLRIYVSDLDNDSARWGMERDGFESCRQTFAEFIDRIDGLTFHLARNYRLRTIEKVLDRVEVWLGLIENGSCRVLNIGGGYRDTLPRHLGLRHNLDAFYGFISQRIAVLKDRFRLAIWAEPGRSIVESAGFLQTSAMQVRFRKPDEIVVAVELNIGVRAGAHPTEITVVSEGRREVIYDLALHLNLTYEPHVMCNFVDATCEYDVFYRLPLRRMIQPMETLEFSGLGAYTTCLSSRFHQRASPTVRVI